jgi:hypothetical protein
LTSVDWYLDLSNVRNYSDSSSKILLNSEEFFEFYDNRMWVIFKYEQLERIEVGEIIPIVLEYTFSTTEHGDNYKIKVESELVMIQSKFNFIVKSKNIDL